jgi:hypothetical protein
MSGAILRPALILSLALGAPVALAACAQVASLTQRSARADAALPYRTRLTRGPPGRAMVLRLHARGAGVAEVRESVRFEATRYCLLNVGSSDATWEIDPATGDWRAEPQGDRLAFRARCTGGA